MMYPYCKYADETVHVHFERPTENGFDTVVFELPSYEIVKQDENYSEEEIKEFRDCREVLTYFLNMQEKKRSLLLKIKNRIGIYLERKNKNEKMDKI